MNGKASFIFLLHIYVFHTNKDQGTPIFLSGVSWDGQEGLKDATKRTSNLKLSDVDIIAWWAGDNDDEWGGAANGIGNVCEAHACFIGEYSKYKSWTGHVGLKQNNNDKYC